MDIKGESLQNGEPTPEHPVDIKNKINLTGAIQILNKLKSKVNLVKADEKEYRLPYLISIEKQAIETVLSELEKKDKEYEELLKAYKELKEIEESHRKENGELREKVKQLEEENKTLNERR